MGPTFVEITLRGQVSLPAAPRERWRTGGVLVIDRGGFAIIRPVPRDPFAALRGAHAGPGPSTEEARTADRADGESVEGRIRRPEWR